MTPLLNPFVCMLMLNADNISNDDLIVYHCNYMVHDH